MPVRKYGWRSSWKYGCAWDQLRTLHKYLSRWDWRDYWYFFTLSPSSSQCPTVLVQTRAQPGNISHKAAWLSRLKYLLACELALTGPPLGLITSDNKKKFSVWLPLPFSKKQKYVLANYFKLQIIFFKKKILRLLLSLTFVGSSLLVLDWDKWWFCITCFEKTSMQ